MKLFSGTANKALSEKVAHLLSTPLSLSEVVRFDNSEVRVRIEEEVAGETCVVIQPTANPTDTHIMELLFFADALKRAEAAKIMGVIPYFGYARQNLQHRPGEAVSAHVVIRMLEASGFDEILSIDLHDEATAGIFSIPFTNLSALPLLAKEVAKNTTPSSCVVVTPDQGGVERARTFANAFFGKEEDTVVIEKKRDLDHPHKSAALELFGTVEGKTAIIVDDIVTSAGTLLNAANLCLSKGATHVIAAVTHHDFAPEAAKKIQESSIETFYTTDTIALSESQRFDKLIEISVAPLIAEHIKEGK